MLIRAGILVDGTGEASKKDIGIRVEEGEIVTVDNFLDIDKREDEAEIDASELTVLPGLIEAHTHLLGNGDPEGDAFRDTFIFNSVGESALNSFRNALLNLEAGFTTIRDAGSRDYVDVALRDMIDGGKFIGPNLIVSGEALAATGGHMDRTKDLSQHVNIDHVSNLCDGPTEARKAARKQIKMGADWIKIAASLSEYVRDKGGLYSPELSEETIEEICKIAHWTDRKVGAHCHGGDRKSVV